MTQSKKKIVGSEKPDTLAKRKNLFERMKEQVEKKEQAEKKESLLTKAKKLALIAFATATIANACQGETDLSPYAIPTESDVQVEMDAGADVPSPKDAGVKDAGPSDVSVSDVEQVEDVGPKCLSNNESQVTLKLSLSGKEVTIKAGDKLTIDGKTYTVNISSNSDDVLFTDENGQVTVVSKENPYVNGERVELIDKAVDKVYYGSKVLLEISCGDEKQSVILGEHDVTFSITPVQVCGFGGEVEVKSIIPWDSGVVMNADLRISMPDNSSYMKENVPIRADGYTISIDENGNKRELMIKPLDFSIDLYSNKSTAKELCEITKPYVDLNVNGTLHSGLSEHTKTKAGLLEVYVGETFIGSTNKRMVEVKADLATTNGKVEVANGIYEKGSSINIEDKPNYYTYTISIGNIDFSTTPNNKK